MAERQISMTITV